jgi:hypothetical protein
MVLCRKLKNSFALRIQSVMYKKGIDVFVFIKEKKYFFVKPFSTLSFYSFLFFPDLFVFFSINLLVKNSVFCNKNNI